MRKLILAFLFAAQAFAQSDIAARRIYVGTLSGNRVNIGLDYINSLNSGLPGMTIWALGQSTNYGILRLSNGTGAGGIDANGAQVLAKASDGSVGVEGPLLLYNPSLGSTTSKILYNSDGSLTINQGGTDRLVFNAALEAVFRATPVPATSQAIGTSSKRWSNGYFTVLQVGGTSGNQTNIGLDYINSLNNGTAGATIWALGQSSNKGILRLSDGSGSGGFDSNGAQIYCTASNGECQLGFLSANNGQSFFGASSSGSVVQVQNTSATGYPSLEFLDSGGTSRAFVGYSNNSAASNPDTLLIRSTTAKKIVFSVNGTNGAEFTTTGRFNLLQSMAMNSTFFLDTSLNLTNLNTVSIQTASLSLPPLQIIDASGTTTGNGMQLQTFGGTIYFKVIGGTDSGAPGTVVTRSLVPFTDNLYILGNSSHYWNTVYSNFFQTPGGIGVTQTLTCVAGQHINSVTVNGGIVINGFTCN